MKYVNLAIIVAALTGSFPLIAQAGDKVGGGGDRVGAYQGIILAQSRFGSHPRLNRMDLGELCRIDLV
ncbi:hypothetical protein WDW37_17320 [Bdellovibrionota bacterium FG-1]